MISLTMSKTSEFCYKAQGILGVNTRKMKQFTTFASKLGIVLPYFFRVCNLFSQPKKKVTLTTKFKIKPQELTIICKTCFGL